MTLRLPLTLALLLSTNLVLAAGMQHYEVSITNITKGQTFTPQLVATHNDRVSLFTLGQPASEPLAILAEAGMTDPLEELIMTYPNEIGHVMTVPGLLGPGMTTTFEISGHHRHHRLTFAAMLLPSNDTFVALNGVDLPNNGSAHYMARAYDAGTEENDELCDHIPGPPFNCPEDSPREATSAPADSDEGYVYVSNGIQGIGDFGAPTYDWHNPIARITIKAMHKK